MRNAAGLILASVASVVVIAAAVWFCTYSPRAVLAAPDTVSARKAERFPAIASAKPAPAFEDVAVTAAISAQPAAALKPAAATQPKTACANPDALGVSRVVEIDTTGGPGFGFEHFKQYDFLQPGEVVLTFDDGPWPHNTPAVLAALAAQCTKAIFFPIGEHTMWAPEILKQVDAAG